MSALIILVSLFSYPSQGGWWDEVAQCFGYCGCASLSSAAVCTGAMLFCACMTGPVGPSFVSIVKGGGFWYLILFPSFGASMGTLIYWNSGSPTLVQPRVDLEDVVRFSEEGGIQPHVYNIEDWFPFIFVIARSDSSISSDSESSFFLPDDRDVVILPIQIYPYDVSSFEKPPISPKNAWGKFDSPSSSDSEMYIDPQLAVDIDMLREVLECDDLFKNVDNSCHEAREFLRSRTLSLDDLDFDASTGVGHHNLSMQIWTVIGGVMSADPMLLREVLHLEAREDPIQGT